MTERPTVPKCCDTPSKPAVPGIDCGCLCHYLTPEDLAQLPEVKEARP